MSIAPVLCRFPRLCWCLPFILFTTHAVIAHADLGSCSRDGSTRVRCSDRVGNDVDCQSVACDGAISTTHATGTIHICEVDKCTGGYWVGLCSIGTLSIALCNDSTEPCGPGCVNPAAFISVATTVTSSWNSCRDHQTKPARQSAEISERLTS